MENVSSEELDFDVTMLSDVELANKLHTLGANIGPITNSTRAVYQRKLQRWLKYGPNHSLVAESSFLNLSVEDSVQDAPSLPVEGEKHGSMSIIDDVEVEQLIVVTKQATDGHVCKTSELDASLANKHTKGLPEQRKEKENLPVVSQEDIELVDRIMTSPSLSAVHTTASHQSHQSFSHQFSHRSSTYGDYTRAELPDEEPLLRSRYVNNVTPRPSLKSYREDIDQRLPVDSITRGRTSFIGSPQSEPTTSLTAIKPNSSNKQFSAVRCTILLVVVVGLVIVAVYCNMEPSYAVRLGH